MIHKIILFFCKKQHEQQKKKALKYRLNIAISQNYDSL